MLEEVEASWEAVWDKLYWRWINVSHDTFWGAGVFYVSKMECKMEWKIESKLEDGKRLYNQLTYYIYSSFFLIEHRSL